MANEFFFTKNQKRISSSLCSFFTKTNFEIRLAEDWNGTRHPFQFFF